MITTYDPEKHYERIGHQTQYFLDDSVLEWVKNIQRSNHQATKHSDNPLLRRDRLWEVNPHFNTTVTMIQEPDGQFRCWYLDFTFMDFEGGGAEGQAKPVVLYAESSDGMHWEKPGLGFVKVDGQDTNRIPWDDTFGTPVAFCVMRDEQDPDPARRYKMAFLPEKYNINVPKKTTLSHSHALGLCMAYSADGISWNLEPRNPVSTVWGSDVLTMIRDDELGRYVIYGRAHYTAETGNPDVDQWFVKHYPSQPFGWIPKRSVYRIESEDLISWSDPVRVLAPGAQHNLDDAFYALAYFRMGRYHCGLLPVFHMVENTKDSELIYSHDGVGWNHYTRAPWIIPRGDEGSWDEFQMDTVIPPFQVGDQHYIFYGGADFHHDFHSVGRAQGLDTPETELEIDQLNESLGLATLRRDGFVSLDAGLREGIICTRPQFSTGEKLIINGRCEKGGYIEAEVVDAMENEWKGYTRTDCDRFTGDDVNHTVSWKGNSAVNTIVGYTRFRFYMKKAELYSYRIADE